MADRIHTTVGMESTMIEQECDQTSRCRINASTTTMKISFSRDNVVCLVIDVVRDFMERDGVFCRNYGVEESEPVHAVKQRIVELLDQCQEMGIAMVECCSEYRMNQFRTKGLAMLCVDEQGRQSSLPEHYFKLRVMKQGNSLFDLVDRSQEVDLEREFKDKYVLVAGVTTSSCIRQSVQALIDRGYKVMVARDVVACRQSQVPHGERLLNEWSSDSEHRILVFDSWRELMSQL